MKFSNKKIFIRLTQILHFLLAAPSVIKFKLREGRKIILCPSNDTHVHWMSKLITDTNSYLFLIDPTNAERAQEAINQLGFQSINYRSGILKFISPDCIIFGNDWGRESLSILPESKRNNIPSIVIQEGCLDFVSDTSKRMKNADYAFVMGSIMKNYLDRKNILVTGNPKFIYHEELLPQKHKVMINCNFTYGVYEEQRMSWLSAVVDICKEQNLDYFISQHPRDKASLPDDWNVIKSNTFKMEDQLKNSSILVSRFSTTIYEALCMGRQVIYYNPLNEPYRIFSEDQTGGIFIANDIQELNVAMKNATQSQTNNRDNNLQFLYEHCNINAASTASTIADIINNNIENIIIENENKK